MELLYASLAAFAHIFLRAFQQRNVIFDRYWAVPPISYGMAAMEIYIIATVATRGYGLILVLALGTGAALGAMCAMLLHKRIFGGKA